MSDPEWVDVCIREGYFIVSSDGQMIFDHDIAEIVKSNGGKMCLLKNDVSQLKRWQLARWMFENLPKLARSLEKVEPGSTWRVNRYAELSRVIASSDIKLKPVP